MGAEFKRFNIKFNTAEPVKAIVSNFNTLNNAGPDTINTYGFESIRIRNTFVINNLFKEFGKKHFKNHELYKMRIKKN